MSGKSHWKNGGSMSTRIKALPSPFSFSSPAPSHPTFTVIRNMFSLSKVATFAALALGTFSFATPTTEGPSTGVQRRSTADELQDILRGGINVLSTTCQPLYNLNATTVSAGAIDTINAQIRVQLGAIIDKCNQLPKDGTGIVVGDLPAIANLLADLINVVVQSLYSADNIVGSIEGLLTTLLSTADLLLSGLINAVAGLLTGPVSGLLAQLIALLGNLLSGLVDVSILQSLGLTATLSACGAA
ncbi:hypothetical protein OF83DRAFT_1177293 [Amylostereum chailletii]|nr:hypothetical protein OF83DRAFT_1177293 [Amylostereum chailletii]